MERKHKVFVSLEPTQLRYTQNTESRTPYMKLCLNCESRVLLGQCLRLLGKSFVPMDKMSNNKVSQ